MQQLFFKLEDVVSHTRRWQEQQGDNITLQTDHSRVQVDMSGDWRDARYAESEARDCCQSRLQHVWASGLEDAETALGSCLARDGKRR